MRNIPVPQILIDPQAFYDELIRAVRSTPAGLLPARGAVVVILKTTLELAHVVAEQQVIANG